MSTFQRGESQQMEGSIKSCRMSQMICWPCERANFEVGFASAADRLPTIDNDIDYLVLALNQGKSSPENKTQEPQALHVDRS